LNGWHINVSTSIHLRYESKSAKTPQSSEAQRMTQADLATTSEQTIHRSDTELYDPWSNEASAAMAG
jgi:hypothetical protein